MGNVMIRGMRAVRGDKVSCGLPVPDGRRRWGNLPIDPSSEEPHATVMDFHEQEMDFQAEITMRSDR